MADTPQGGTGGKTDDVPGRESRGRGRIPGWVWVVVIGVGALWLIDFASRIYGPAEIAYSDFKTFVARGEITEATVGAEVITGTVRRKPEVDRTGESRTTPG